VWHSEYEITCYFLCPENEILPLRHSLAPHLSHYGSTQLLMPYYATLCHTQGNRVAKGWHSVVKKLPVIIFSPKINTHYSTTPLLGSPIEPYGSSQLLMPYLCHNKARELPRMALVSL